MSFAPVLRQLAFALFALAASMGVPLILALGLEEPNPGAFGLGIFLSAFVGACLFILSASAPRFRPTRSGFRELILALSIFWLAIPCMAAIPLLGRDYSFANAWFESVSGLTTTGAWLSEPAARSTASGMIYRASLQWLGGLVSLATAAAVFVRPEFIGIQPPTPPFARGKRDSYLRAFATASRTFAPIYASLTFVSYLTFLFAGVPSIEAATLALSFMASGGFAPVPGGITAYGPAAVTAGAVVMTISAINFVLIARLALQGGGRFKAGIDRETLAFFLLLVPLALLFWLSLGTFRPGAFPEQLGNAVSLLSTNGVLIGDVPQLTPILVTAVVGGAAVSTAGGIKLLRWLITFSRAGEELWQLIHPGGVTRSTRAIRFDLGVWIHTIAFTIVLAALVLTVAFFGYELEVAAAAAVAAVSNSGPLLAAVSGATADYIVFTEPLRILLAVGMIAGRLELVLLLLLFDREFWAS
ncbi:MAG: potassium transporter TrkG [Pseudomonadota bacterium]